MSPKKSSKKSPAKPAQKVEPSVTMTVLVGVGIVLAVAGAVLAALGVGGSTAIEVKVGEATLKTESVGLAIMVVGAVLAWAIATNLPKGVKVLGATGASETALTDQVAGWLPLPALIVTGVGIVLFVVSILIK